jgi:hypothetical protein
VRSAINARSSVRSGPSLESGGRTLEASASDPMARVAAPQK